MISTVGLKKLCLAVAGVALLGLSAFIGKLEQKVEYYAGIRG